jgi:hypothetical protein
MRWAEETDDDEHRQIFLDMARDWMRVSTHGPDGVIQANSVTPNDAFYQRIDNTEIG